MRLWSIHPKYLDAKGLLALWREGLLAQKVLSGNTVGYRNHPQLIRFKESASPKKYINQYLWEVLKEAQRRGYNFDKDKVTKYNNLPKLKINRGQLDYEIDHLLAKLAIRDQKQLMKVKLVKKIDAHPIFRPVVGKIEPWEVLD